MRCQPEDASAYGLKLKGPLQLAAPQCLLSSANLLVLLLIAKEPHVVSRKVFIPVRTISRWADVEISGV
jgi:hypothetical protein